MTIYRPWIRFIDDDLAAYFKAVNSACGVEIGYTEKLATIALIRGLKNAGIYQQLDRLWLMSPTCSSAALLDFITLQSMTNVNSATWSTSGWTFNGTTNYLNTNFSPLQNTTKMTSSSMCMGIFLNSCTVSGVNHTIAGCGDLALSQLKINASETTGNTTFSYYAGSAVAGRNISYTAASFASGIGFHASSRTSSTLISANVTGHTVETATGSSTSVPPDSANLFLGAMSNSGASTFYTPCTMALAFAGAGLSQTQLRTFDNLQRLYQMALGRYAYTPAASTYFTNQSITDQTEKYAVNRAIHAMIHGRIWQTCDRVYLRSPTSKAAALACAKSNNSQTDVNNVTWSTGGIAYDGVADYLRGDVAVNALTNLKLNSTHAFIQWKGSYNQPYGVGMMGAKLTNDYYVLFSGAVA